MTADTDSVIVTLVNPHRLRGSSDIETALGIEANGSAVGHQNMLVKIGVARLEPRNNCRPDSTTVM